MPAVAPVTSAVLMPRQPRAPPLDSAGAHRYLERQLHPLPHRPRRGLAASVSDVDVLALQETKCRDDQFPDGPARGPRLRGRPPRPLAVERRRADLPGRPRGRPGRLRGDAALGRPARRGGAGARRAPAAGCGSGRSTSPTGARSATRTWTTSSTGWSACARRRARLARRGPGAAGRARRRLEHRPAGRGRLGHGLLRGQDPRVRRRSARRSRRSLDAGYTDVVRPHTPGPGIYTYWDYTQLRFPKRQGMRIDFVLGSPALAGRVDGARPSTARSARARAPATTRRSIVDLADH